MKDGDALDRQDLWRWARKDCKYCNGTGRVRVVGGGEKVCDCARERIIRGRKPRPKEDKLGSGPGENK